MKNMRYMSLAAVLFFTISVPSAFANVSSESTDPVYAQDFYFYCTPYKHTFEADHHYKPASGAGNFCYYSLPSTVSGTRAVFLYRGAVGSAVAISGDVVTGPAAVATLVAQSPNNIPTNAVDEEDFFAVVYDTSLGSAFTDHLTTGTPLPAEAVEGQNFYILPWKWGPKPASEFDPLIIVPDIFTTWGTASGQQVDPVFKQYQNLIDTLVANGYVLDQNLFLFPYNWRQSNVTSATELQNFITGVKTTCNCNLVDIVGHGMGGTMTQQYIESAGYAGDVDQALFLATPFYGIPSAYFGWGGGEVRFGNTLNDNLIQALIDQEATDLGYASTYAYVQGTPILSFKELLPPGGYLFPGPAPANPFMTNLLANIFALQQVRMNIFMADDWQGTTIVSINTTASTNPPLWPDGQPTSIFTDSGDTMVPRSSIENVFGADFEFAPTTHRALPTEAQSSIFNILNNRTPSPVVANAYPVSCILFISASQPVDIMVTDPNGNRLGKDFETSNTLSEIDDAFYSGFSGTTEYGVVVNPLDGDYQVDTQGTGSGSFTINATEFCGSTAVSTSTTSTTNPGEVIGYNVTLEPDGSISITPLPSPQPPPPPAPTYVWGDFLQPITSTGHEAEEGISVFKANSTVPVKFQVFNVDGEAIETAEVAPWIEPVQLGPLDAPVTEPEYTAPATSGYAYEWIGDHYQYNWKTKGFAAGYWYKLYVVLDDGSVHSVVIGLR